jgi:hypothetical protein
MKEHRKLYVAALPALLSVLAGAQAATHTQRALLIGINTYQPEGTQAQHPPAASMADASWEALKT